jgi:hypothetical protein
MNKEYRYIITKKVVWNRVNINKKLFNVGQIYEIDPIYCKSHWKEVITEKNFNDY